MPTTYTPLRYPGGKSKLGPYLARLMVASRLVDATYAEPYAGGAGAGLYLMFRGYASDLRINDIDPGVVAFWKAVRDENERFAREIERVPLTVMEWDKQKSALRMAAPGFEKGFAFFYLNRTNRSGIMNAGVIGGREQTGRWNIDARFNREALARRVRALATFRRRISVTRYDAKNFIQSLKSERRILLYLDPPYYSKGKALYTNYYTPTDHAVIAAELRALACPWVLTYDDCNEIRQLYTGYDILDSELSYSAREVRRGREIVVLGPKIVAPQPVQRPRGHQPGFEVLQNSDCAL